METTDRELSQFLFLSQVSFCEYLLYYNTLKGSKVALCLNPYPIEISSNKDALIILIRIQRGNTKDRMNILIWKLAYDIDRIVMKKRQAIGATIEDVYTVWLY